jgi:PleD family two-component response regulator
MRVEGIFLGLYTLKNSISRMKTLACRVMADILSARCPLAAMPVASSCSGACQSGWGCRLVFSFPNFEFSKLVRLADHQLYLAKNSGRNRICTASRRAIKAVQDA